MGKTSNDRLKAPFPWFGGKSRVADVVWSRFGAGVANYVEPFAGSLAVLLARPGKPRVETVNDLDCYVANFWRALKYAPAQVTEWAAWPVNEADLHARHLWLVKQDEFREKMKMDPAFYDARIAGWWVWGICCWIGSGWCSKPEWAGRINGNHSARGVPAVRRDHGNDPETNHRRPHLSRDQGVHAQERNPRSAGQQIWRKRPELKRGGRGVCERAPTHQLPDIGGDGSSGRGVHSPTVIAEGAALLEWMQQLAARLRRVRVCCGDWKRVLGRSPTECVGTTAILLDPPYASDRDSGIYAHDSLTVAPEVREWALAHGDNTKLRIALCGYEGDHEMPKSWECLAWKANGGHGNAANGRGRANAKRERVWFSPHCLKPSGELFAL